MLVCCSPSQALPRANDGKMIERTVVECAGSAASPAMPMVLLGATHVSAA